MKCTLYCIFSVMIDGQSGIGRNTVEIEANVPINFSNIKRIEEVMLAKLRETKPTASNLFLTDWKWIEPDPADAIP